MSKNKRDLFLSAAGNLPYEDVPCDEIEKGLMIRIQGLNSKSASQYGKSMVVTDEDGKVISMNMDNFMAELVALTAIDEETGERLFLPEDVEKIGLVSAQVVKRLNEVAQRLSGMEKDAVKNAVKN